MSRCQVPVSSGVSQQELKATRAPSLWKKYLENYIIERGSHGIALDGLGLTSSSQRSTCLYLYLSNARIKMSATHA